MTNFLIDNCKKLVIPAYLATQLLVALAVRNIHVNPYPHLALLIAASIAYLIVALKDPGKVIYSQEENQNSRKIEKGIIVPAPLDYPQAIESKPFPDDNMEAIKQQKQNEVNELGLQSVIKSSLSEEAKRDFFKKNKKSESDVKQIISNINPSDLLEGELVGSNLVKGKTDSQFKSIQKALTSVQRYCKICKGDQPLRVRHCLDCGICVYTFDHHCPWMNNCIGEKNKLFLILFLMFQAIQFLGLAADIAWNINRGITRQVIALWFVVISFGFVLLGVFIFQLYMILINLTTWESLRWYRIQYLLIFSREKLRSLFDQGICSNIRIFFRENCSKEPIDWLHHLNPQAEDSLNSVSNTQRRLHAEAAIR